MNSCNNKQFLGLKFTKSNLFIINVGITYSKSMFIGVNASRGASRCAPTCTVHLIYFYVASVINNQSTISLICKNLNSILYSVLPIYFNKKTPT